LPKPGHVPRPVDQGRQGAQLSAVVRLATFVAVAYESGLLKNREMLRDGRLRDPGPSCQCSDRLLSLTAQPFEERPPGRIGQCSEEAITGVRHRINNPLAIGDKPITTWLCMSRAGWNLRNSSPIAGRPFFPTPCREKSAGRAVQGLLGATCSIVTEGARDPERATAKIHRLTVFAGLEGVLKDVVRIQVPSA